MARASRAPLRKQKRAPLCRDTTSQESDDQDVIFIAENGEKRIGKHKSLLEDIRATPDFKSLPETLRHEIEQALSSSNLTKSSVAFIGESGSGKSTTINALLGMQLLPTDSSGEACTAIAIEIHSAKGNDFHGMVRYVSLDAWCEELQQVQNMLRNESDDDVEENAKVLEKIKMVYPRLKLEDFKEMTIEEILEQNEDTAQKLKGDRTEKLPNRNWDEFTSALYECAVPNHRKSQIWPLVEVVEVYIDSPILENGLILIDIPGVLDSNRTRSDRAQEYIRSSAAVCIVTCAQRCISNATSYDLIKDVLEQIQYGGHLERVVLINSKSDSFEADEVRTRLDDRAISDAHKEKDEARKEYVEVSEILKLKRKRFSEQEKALKQSKTDISTYKKKLTKLQKDEGPIYDVPRLDPARVMGKKERTPLTTSIIQTRIKTFQTQNSQANEATSDLKGEIPDLEIACDEKKTEHERLLQCYHGLCLHARNKEVKEQQRKKFMKIVKQCDEAAAISSQCPDNSQKFEDLSDEKYEAQKEQIPVFCVSAKVYLDLQNIRLYEDTPTTKIDNKEDTDIPALSEHLMQMVKSIRSERSENMLKALTTAVHSVYLHVMKTSTKQPVDFDIADRAARKAETYLQNLRANFKRCGDTCSSSIKNHFQLHLAKNVTTFAKTALREATTVLGVFGECPTAHKKTGHYPQEYKAIVFGYGIHVGSRVKINLNKRIARCLEKAMHPSMKQVYLSTNSCIQQELKLLIKSCVEDLESTHNKMREYADDAGVSPFALVMVEDQLKKRKAALHRMGMEFDKKLKDAPSSAGKDLKNQIKKEMSNAYEEAQNASKGFGMLKRMSSEVVAGVQKQNGALITRCLREFDKALYEVTEKAVNDLSSRMEKFSDSVSQNYQDAFRQRDQHHWTSDNPIIRRMLLKSGLISHKQLTDDDKMFIDQAAGIKLEASEADVEMGDGDGGAIKEGDDTMENIDAVISMDPIEELEAAAMA